MRTLLAEERQRADRYLEASTIWQSRALQLEERLKALGAGPIVGDIPQDVPQERNPAPLRDDDPQMTTVTLSKPFEAPDRASDSLALGWRRWWRRFLGQHRGA